MQYARVGGGGGGSGCNGGRFGTSRRRNRYSVSVSQGECLLGARRRRRRRRPTRRRRRRRRPTRRENRWRRSRHRFSEFWAGAAFSPRCGLGSSVQPCRSTGRRFGCNPPAGRETAWNCGCLGANIAFCPHPAFIRPAGNQPRKAKPPRIIPGGFGVVVRSCPSSVAGARCAGAPQCSPTGGSPRLSRLPLPSHLPCYRFCRSGVGGG